MTHIADHERAAICDLLDKIGPDQPTLCEGWRTRDLAAHLVLREARPDAAAGIAIPFLAGWTSRVQNSYSAGDFSRLVDRLRSGPPIWSPMRPAPLNEAGNGIEFFIHHEDIRRAQPEWKPRTLDSTTEDLFWRRVKFAAKSSLRRKGFGLDVVRADTGKRRTLRPAAPADQSVTVSGMPSELLLFFFGRRDHAVVEKQGDTEAFDHPGR